MTVPTIFDTCRPRADVLTGAMTEADFAADLAQVILGEGHAEYLDPARFFAHTYPTRGLKNLLANVCRRRGRVPGRRCGHQWVPRRAALKWCPHGHVPMAA